MKDPNEAVVRVVGATILSGQVNHITVVDVKSRTLGIELNGGAIIPIIKRNNVIPTKKTRMYAVVFLPSRHDCHFLIISSSVSQLLLTTNVL